MAWQLLGINSLTKYSVSLETYNGPLDLLLFLIKREEVDIYDIPIARITKQYVEFIDLLQQVDPEAVGDFLVLAATLMEIKSRTLLPTPPPEEVDEEIIDPRLELVKQLLEYKNFKDAASTLEDSALERSQRFERKPVLPPSDGNEVELDNLEVWDLLEAFNRLLEQTGKREAVHQVTVDDTPIALHADDIIDSLTRAEGMQLFEEVFKGRTRSEMIGLFLALLELIRQKRVTVCQPKATSGIQIQLIDAAPIDATQADEDYTGGASPVDEDGKNKESTEFARSDAMAAQESSKIESDTIQSNDQEKPKTGPSHETQ